MTPEWLTFLMLSGIQVITVVVVITTLRNRLNAVVHELELLRDTGIVLATLNTTLEVMSKELNYLRDWKHDWAVPLDARVSLLELRLAEIQKRRD